MPVYEVPAATLPAFAYSLRTITEDVPNRWEKISQYMTEFCHHYPGVLMSTPVKMGENGKTVLCDVRNKVFAKKLFYTIQTSPSTSVFFEEMDFEKGFNGAYGVPLYPLVFIPDESTCMCGGTLKTPSRPAIVTIYSLDGVRNGSNFHKTCDRCKVKFYQSYQEDPAGTKLFRGNTTDLEYFIISRKTGFQRLFLQTMIDLIETTGVTFTGITESYLVTHDRQLERQRFEEAYFLYKIASVYSRNCTQHQLKVDQRDDNARIDIERLCSVVLETIDPAENPFLKHSCDVSGCKDGFLMADGIEKIYRKTCAAPNMTIQLSKAMPRVISSCPETPVGQGEYCSDHQDLVDNNSDSPSAKKCRVVLTIDLVNMRSSSDIVDMSDDLPDNDDDTVMVGCKKPSSMQKFRNRSAGLMALVRPCGIIVDVCEILTCESSSQLFVQLLRARCDYGLEFKYLGYDRGCEFHPFLKNLSRKGNRGAEILLENTEYLVDRFHIKGHVSTKCVLDSPDCEYHPDMDKFVAISSVNTECAEQCFAWLRKFKHTFKYMSKYKYLFFLHCIIASRNQRTEQKHQAHIHH